MLQASEYTISEYLSWLHRTRDFAVVQKRKKLRYTLKAKTLLIIFWMTFAATVILGYLIYHILGAVTAVILYPFLAPYLILVPLYLGKLLIQRPRERQINATTKDYLEQHAATRIGVAGSYGKTTFKEILFSILGAGRKVAASKGNYNTAIGLHRFIKELDGDEDVLIFELGEYYPGDIEKLSVLVKPQIGVITGVNEAHLEKFKTLDRTRKAIFELADYLNDRNVYVNGDSSLALAGVRNGHIIYTHHGTDKWIVDEGSIKVGLGGISFSIRNGSRLLKLQSQLLGRHQVGPLSAAVAIAAELGLSDKQIIKGVATTKPFEHRMQLSPQTGGVIWIDDSYNGNPAGAAVAIAFLGELTHYRRIYVTPGLVEMGSRKKEVHLELGRLLAISVDVVVLIRNSATAHIEHGLNDATFSGEVLWYDTIPAALAALPLITKSGDVVLLQNDWPDNYA